MTAFSKTPSTRRLALVFLICGLIWILSGPTARAQTAAASPSARTDQSADDVREQFHSVLRLYSPTLGQILRLDSTLITREDYLATYPAVAAFVKQHPEILRNPEFYLPRLSTNYGYYVDPADRAWSDTIEWFGAFLITVTIVGALGWLVRTAVDYRRWGRLAKVQAEAHTKLLDRFTGNEDLLAYVQSPAGARFLKSSPIALDGGPRAMGSPISRILWSMQAGLVLGAAGIGLNYAAGRIDPEHAEPIFMFSVLMISIGAGFFGSAGLSYLMSKRMGLLGLPAERDEA